ncbi:CobW family GTP-binding protein [Atopobacter phocae]|uniref:CobW family GTP-binding protein n=1 Tax=Atopobacter phocae TaxID=136492 RepID=UPI0004719834|nr:GTP-binding protein [Atopobacter phocae]
MELIPVTIITGFLGAGKTTLINRVLHDEHDQKIAVIINEYGEQSIDHQLVLKTDEDIFQMENGCLCCTLRTDIVDMLRSILHAKEKAGVQVDHILIETTGLADPAPLVQTFFNVPYLKQHFKIDSVITLVDALHIENQIKQQPEPRKQIGFADRIYLTKTKDLSRQQIEHVRHLTKEFNPLAPIELMDLQTIGIDDILHRDEFMLNEQQLHALQHAQEEFEHEAEHHHHEHAHDHNHNHEHEHHHHEHHSDIVSLSLVEKTPLHLETVQLWLNELIQTFGTQLYRYKGILSIENVPHQIIVQGVQMSFDVTKGRLWEDTDERQTTLVLIGRRLPKEELMDSFETCVPGYFNDNPYRQF